MDGAGFEREVRERKLTDGSSVYSVRIWANDDYVATFEFSNIEKANDFFMALETVLEVSVSQ